MLEPPGDVSVPGPSPELTVGFALVKGERPEVGVQKLTELGVDRIVPFVAARSVVRWDPTGPARQVERLRRVARGGGHAEPAGAGSRRSPRASPRSRPWPASPVSPWPTAMALPDWPSCAPGRPEGGWDDADQAATGVQQVLAGRPRCCAPKPPLSVAGPDLLHRGRAATRSP